MGYQLGHYYGSGGCTSLVMYFPTGSDYVRNGITNAYASLFGRYAEPGGMSFHIAKWNTGLWTSFTAMVADTSMAEAGAYSGLSAGGCPPPIVYGCTDPSANNYNPSATPGNSLASSGCTYDKPEISKFDVTVEVDGELVTSTETSLILHQPDETPVTYTLNWSAYGNPAITTRQLYLNGALDRSLSTNSGSLTLSPSDGTDLRYQLYVYNKGGVVSSGYVDIAVYVKPTVTLSTDDGIEDETEESDNIIVLGESLTLSWVTTGDADTLMVDPGIGPSNLVSSVSISPTVTTTYTATATGLGGTGSDELTVTVLQPPSVTVTGPASVDYGSSITVTCDGTNVPTSFKVTPYYYDLDNIAEAIKGDDVTLTTGDEVSETVTFDDIPWGDRGPTMIDFVVMAEGYGGLTANDLHVATINIDQNPDLITVPESSDRLKNDDPVISPDREIDLIELEVTDIDIPVEVKSDRPTQVEIDNDGNYRDIRQI